MTHTNATLRDLYLWDLEFTGDPTHGNRPQKVKNIEQWRNVPLFEQLSHHPSADMDLTTETRRVFVWSDIHFGHKNIIKYSGRPYPSHDIMNDCLVGNYLNTVQEQDVVIFGGDISFMSDTATNEILGQLPGYKIQIVGNHDIERNGKLKNLNFDERRVCMALDTGTDTLLFTHYPLTTVPKGCINVHGHIHQHPAPSSRHLNICVEHTNYTPRLLKEYLDTLYRATQSE